MNTTCPTCIIPHLKTTPPLLITSSSLLCFIASSISGGGGIGGGGLYIPILTVVAGFGLKRASTFSSFMVTGGSLANVVCNFFMNSGTRTGMEYEIALLSEPFMLVGVGFGVILNLVFPEWLVLVLFVVFLVWSTFRTCRSGVVYWKMEREEVGKNERLLEREEELRVGIPWMKLGFLVLIWVCFFGLYVLRGNRYGQGLLPIDPCGIGYWILTSAQLPLAILFTTLILCTRDSQEMEEESGDCGEEKKKKVVIFPVMALMGGVLGGMFGIGGGMLISPLLLHLGIIPQVTAAACSIMVFFSSTMSAVQFLLLGMQQKDTYNALLLSTLCFLGSLLGQVVLHGAIKNHHQRASIIVFSVGTVMAFSTILLTSFGALDVYRDYKNGEYMGFKQPC